MAAARQLLRIAVLPALLALMGAQPAPVTHQIQGAAQVQLPPDCESQIREALQRAVIPDLSNCPVSITQRVSDAYDSRVRFDPRHVPDERAAVGIIFRQDPGGGSPLQKRPVVLYVSTGPPSPPPTPQPPPPPPPPEPEPEPLTVGPVTVSAADAVAGKPLEFRISPGAAAVGGKIRYSIRSGSARPGVDYVDARGERQLDPDADPILVEVQTRPNPAATAAVTLTLVVSDGDRVLDEATGTISQPAIAPCPGGEEPPCAPAQPPGELCPDGKPLPCKQSPPWPPIFDFLPILATGLAVGMGKALADALQPPPSPPPPPPPPPSPPVPGFEFAATTAEPTPPRLASSGAGLKSPIISLAWTTTRGAARPLRPPSSPEDDHD